jgi:hypothetical protein
MKKREFAQKENRNHWLSDDKHMKKYVYIEMHEILLALDQVLEDSWSY